MKTWSTLSDTQRVCSNQSVGSQLCVLFAKGGIPQGACQVLPHLDICVVAVVVHGRTPRGLLPWWVSSELSGPAGESHFCHHHQVWCSFSFCTWPTNTPLLSSFLSPLCFDHATVVMLFALVILKNLPSLPRSSQC